MAMGSKTYEPIHSTSGVDSVVLNSAQCMPVTVSNRVVTTESPPSISWPYRASSFEVYKAEDAEHGRETQQYQSIKKPFLMRSTA
jgi:hypothetical protein